MVACRRPRSALPLRPFSPRRAGTSRPRGAGRGFFIAWAAVMGALLRPLERPSRLELAFVGALAAFAAWQAVSAIWGPATAAGLETERTFVYVAAAVALLALVGREYARFLVAGVLAGIVVVSLYALSTRLFPNGFNSVNTWSGARLSTPIGYWNGLGIVAGIGVAPRAGLRRPFRDTRCSRRCRSGRPAARRDALLHVQPRGLALDLRRPRRALRRRSRPDPARRARGAVGTHRRACRARGFARGRADARRRHARCGDARWAPGRGSRPRRRHPLGLRRLCPRKDPKHSPAARAGGARGGACARPRRRRRRACAVRRALDDRAARLRLLHACHSRRHDEPEQPPLHAVEQRAPGGVEGRAPCLRGASGRRARRGWLRAVLGHASARVSPDPRRAQPLSRDARRDGHRRDAHPRRGAPRSARRVPAGARRAAGRVRARRATSRFSSRPPSTGTGSSPA